MFTGIVEDIGRVTAVDAGTLGRRVIIATALDLGETRMGDSIAVDGICLTVVKLQQQGSAWQVAFDVGPETLRVTAFSALRVGSRVHLERALRFSDRLGGHLVAGHVDGIGLLQRAELRGDSLFLRFCAPAEVLRLCVQKGSIAVNGTSLTINAVDDEGFEVTLVPHTLSHTHLGELREGDRVNLESDLVGKYVERLLLSRSAHDTAPSGASSGVPARVDEALLAEAGFLERK